MTTVAVAESLGRRGVGLEIKPEYIEMGRKRVRQTNRGLPLFSP
jgi:DNA modification methylase